MKIGVHEMCDRYLLRHGVPTSRARDVGDFRTTRGCSLSVQNLKTEEKLGGLTELKSQA